MEINAKFCKSVLSAKEKWDNGTAKQSMTSISYIYENSVSPYNAHGIACHYNMKKRDGDKIPIAICNFITKNLRGKYEVKKEHFINFYDWMANLSPWAPIFVSKDAEDVWEQEFCIVDTKYQYNSVAQCLIALRLCWEFPNHIKAWYTLYQNGIDGLVAFAMSYSCGDKHITMGSQGHCALDGRYINLAQVFSMANTTLEDFNKVGYDKSYAIKRNYNNIFHALEFKRGYKKTDVSRINSILECDKLYKTQRGFDNYIIKKANFIQDELKKLGDITFKNNFKEVIKDKSEDKKKENKLHPVDAWLKENGEK